MKKQNKSQKGKVFYNSIFSGIIEKTRNGEYIFTYDDNYLNDINTESISLTLPKEIKVHHSKFLFPFFFGLLSEGANKKLQCKKLKIDENDHFTRLIKTADKDTIGPITVEEYIT